MLNKIKLTLVMLFLCASLGNAETYDEFRAKNGMESKGKIVKSSTSTKFQKAPVNTGVMVKKLNSSSPILELQEVQRELTIDDINIVKFTEKEFEDKFNYMLQHLGFEKKFSFLPSMNQIVTVENLNSLNGKINSDNTSFLKITKASCLSHGKRFIADGMRIDAVAAVFKDYKRTPSPINENKVLIDETVMMRACLYKFKK